MIRTRFAPSPTGRLHPGNARVAVLNWLFARHHDGAFVLRIEDTDEERATSGAEAGILEDLRWLGLDWDEGPGAGGPHAPYRQSRRRELYREHADRLVDARLAFPCYCTEETLARKRERAIAEGRQPHYDGACRELSDEEAARLEREGRTPAIRFRVPEEGTIVVEDVVRGAVRFEASEIGDFILLRSDGLPTYNFAVVVDDAAMEITHVIRGAGHLSNTPRQVLLYEALEREPPKFVHMPTVLGPDRTKLSKRHGALAVADLRRRGVHPDAVVNYLSLLSWSSPSGDEFLTRERLVNEVSLERVGASDVVFDEEKLRWLSHKHLERMPAAEFVEAASAYVDRERYPLADDVLPLALEAIRHRLYTLSEVNDHLDPFVSTLDAEGERARDGLGSDEEAQAVIGAARERLAGIDDWSPPAIKDAVRAAGEEADARGRALYHPVRIALTGRTEGPALARIASVLGRAAVLRLLDDARAAA